MLVVEMLVLEYIELILVIIHRKNYHVPWVMYLSSGLQNFYCWHLCSSALHIFSFETLGFIYGTIPQREPFWSCKTYNTEIQTKLR